MNVPAHFLSNAVPSPILNLTASGCGDLFASAETDGWRIWESTSLLPVAIKSMLACLQILEARSLIVKRIPDSPNGSLSKVLPLHRSGLVFLVGGPPSPLYAPNKVIIYSLVTKSVTASLEFQSAVLGVCARRDRFAVVLRKRIVVFGIRQDPAAIVREASYETADNPRGLASVATEIGSSLLCFPGRQAGHVAIVKLPPLEKELSSAVTQSAFPTTSILLAHTTPLAAISINPSGSTIATASNKGTLIRVYNPKTSTLLHELRRGSDSAEIFSLSLRPDGGALACASDKGTIHLWDLQNPTSSSKRLSMNEPLSTNEGFSLLKPYLPKYFSSSWSDAQFKLPPPEAQAAKSLPFLDAFADEKLETPRTVEEDKVMLTWTTIERKVEEVKYQGNMEGRKERRELREKAKRGHEESIKTQSPAEDPSVAYALIAATHSGAWYKLAAFEKEDMPTSEQFKRKEKGKTKDQDTSEGYGPSGRCRMIDHKRFEQRDDFW